MWIGFAFYLLLSLAACNGSNQVNVNASQNIGVINGHVGLPSGTTTNAPLFTSTTKKLPALPGRRKRDNQVNVNVSQNIGNGIINGPVNGVPTTTSVPLTTTTFVFGRRKRDNPVYIDGPHNNNNSQTNGQNNTQNNGQNIPIGHIGDKGGSAPSGLTTTTTNAPLTSTTTLTPGRRKRDNPVNIVTNNTNSQTNGQNNTQNSGQNIAIGHIGDKSGNAPNAPSTTTVSLRTTSTTPLISTTTVAGRRKRSNPVNIVTNNTNNQSNGQNNTQNNSQNIAIGHIGDKGGSEPNGPSTTTAVSVPSGTTTNVPLTSTTTVSPAPSSTTTNVPLTSTTPQQPASGERRKRSDHGGVNVSNVSQNVANGVVGGSINGLQTENSSNAPPTTTTTQQPLAGRRKRDNQVDVNANQNIVVVNGEVQTGNASNAPLTTTTVSPFGRRRRSIESV